MSSVSTRKSESQDLLVVPIALQKQLGEFRSRVWSRKMLEAFTIVVVATMLAFLTVYFCDRILDTPQSARVLIFAIAMFTWLVIPRALHRWVWKNRKLEQLARLLRVRSPSIGDRLLSVIELASNPSEQARSRTLCAAAIAQVAQAAEKTDLHAAAPPHRLRPLAMLCGASFLVILSLAVLFPDATLNALKRFAIPWRSTPRYTFTSIESIPDSMVIPHGEAQNLYVRLADNSRWKPESASLQMENLPSLVAELDEANRLYAFSVPPQVSPTQVKIVVGDFYQTVALEPKTRPELIGAEADIMLPSYLGREHNMLQDVRSGTLMAVQGSRATVNATASRDIESATVNANPVQVDRQQFSSDQILLGDKDSSVAMEWIDFDGLTGREPFELTIASVVDEIPTVIAQDFPRQAVVLDSEQINFRALAADDFGVKRIGMVWNSLDETLAKSVSGEKVISAGGPENTSMQVPATFSAQSLGIEAQPIEVKLWAEDYLPNRERVFSVPHVLFVLTADQHAIWITNQLNKWQRASLDVRDKEMQLHEANKRLLQMSSGELQGDELRSEIERQAALERANGRQLAALTSTGEGLLRQAARNPEIAVDHLEQWAEMLQVLNDISQNRMPSVADLLSQASQQAAQSATDAQQQPSTSDDNQKPSGPSVGQNRANVSKDDQGQQSESQSDEDQPTLPSISDIESSNYSPDDQESDSESGSKQQPGGAPRLSLPSTPLYGPASSGDQPPESEEQEEDSALQEALFEQDELLAEFAKISDELNAILANLEGSTLVKRLKAASREQDQVAQRIGSRISGFFGQPRRLEEDQQLLTRLSEIEETSSETVSFIMDDMQSYYERRRMEQFKVVLDDMKETDVLAALLDLGEAIPKKQGMSIAQAEYWSDTMDRWAEDLVDPAGGEQSPPSESQGADALPPRLILEMLKILESEVNLREETRVTDQARAAVDPQVHTDESQRLADTQNELGSRVGMIVSEIVALPDGESRFGAEVELLTAVQLVMADATQLLSVGETGSEAIAAETEAIELMLQSNRINPQGASGGGGVAPGAGGKGSTDESALALLGSGLNQNERREAREVGQATGESGRALPEEFRSGLDKYFELIEQVR